MEIAAAYVVASFCPFILCKFGIRLTLFAKLDIIVCSITSPRKRVNRHRTSWLHMALNGIDKYPTWMMAFLFQLRNYMVKRRVLPTSSAFAWYVFLRCGCGQAYKRTTRKTIFRRTNDVYLIKQK
jgi:hypothetical protein